MAKKRRYLITIKVVVIDGPTLLKTARDDAKEHACGCDIINTYGAAAQWLLDKTPDNCGFEIEHSNYEEIRVP